MIILLTLAIFLGAIDAEDGQLHDTSQRQFLTLDYSSLQIRRGGLGHVVTLRFTPPPGGRVLLMTGGCGLYRCDVVLSALLTPLWHHLFCRVSSFVELSMVHRTTADPVSVVRRWCCGAEDADWVPRSRRKMRGYHIGASLLSIVACLTCCFSLR